MALLPTVNTQGAATGHVNVSDDVFNVEPNTGLIHDVVVAFQANQRQGTHKTKVRSEVSGGGIKPDVYVPYDTSFLSVALLKMVYSEELKTAIWDYFIHNKQKLGYKSITDYNQSFNAQIFSLSWG